MIWVHQLASILRCVFDRSFASEIICTSQEMCDRGGYSIGLKSPARGGNENGFFSAFDLRAPEELDNKLGIWEYLNSELYRFLNFFWSE